MKKIIALSFLAMSFVLHGAAQDKPEKIILFHKLEIFVPPGFTPLSTDLFEARHPGVLSKPLWLISYDNRKVIAASTNTEKEVDDNGIPAFTDQLISELKSSTKDFKLLDDGILLKDGKNIGYIKFISELKDQKIFNYMFYISMNERLVLFSFDCPKKLRKKWEAKAEEIAGSLHLLL